MADQKPLATRPGWLPPTWICLTLESGVPVYLDVERILYVCGSGVAIEGNDSGMQVREESHQIFGAITEATRNMRPR